MPCLSAADEAACIVGPSASGSLKGYAHFDQVCPTLLQGSQHGESAIGMGVSGTEVHGENARLLLAEQDGKSVHNV